MPRAVSRVAPLLILAAVLLFFAPTHAAAQCSSLVVNPITGQLDCTSFQGFGTAGQCLVSNGTTPPTFQSCGGASNSWSAITNPIGNTSLAMAAFTTVLTWNGATGAGTSLFTLTDTASNTGTGMLLNVKTAIGSALTPFQATAGGGSDGVQLNTSGLLQAIGAGGIKATTAANGAITNAMLAGSIAASKLIGTDIATVGTVTAGTWNATVITGQYGGTGVANTGKTITLGGNLTTSGAFNTTLTVTADTNVTLPVSGTLVNSAVTTLSSLVSVATITTGVWNATVISPVYGGTGAASPTAHTIPVAEGASAYAFLSPSTAGFCLISNGTGSDPSFQSCVASAAWSSLTNPTANLSLTMAARLTTFTYSSATGAAVNLFTLTDGASNTGTGALLNSFTAAGSSAFPFRFTAGGASDGIYMETDGIVEPLGLGGISGFAIVTDTVAKAFLGPAVFTDQTNTWSTGTQDMSAVTKTLTVKAVVAAATPSSCTPNKELLIKTDVTQGQQLFLCNNAGTGYNLLGDGSGGGGGSTAWSSLTDSVGNLAVNMLGNTSVFTWGNATGASTNMWAIRDTASNTGTGAVVAINTATSSAASPIQITAGGTANGVKMNTSGVLAAIGTGGITATQFMGLTSGTSGGIPYFSSSSAISSSAAWTLNTLMVGGGAGASPTVLALGSANRVLGMNAAGTAHEYKTLTSTANQVTVTHGVNTVTFSTPQNIDTGATPQFGELGLSVAASATNIITGGLTAGQRVLSITQLSGETSAVNLIDIAATWNNAANTPTAFKMNITDTASNAASLIADWQIGGVSRFKFAKNGTLTLGGTSSGLWTANGSSSGGCTFTVPATAGAWIPGSAAECDIGTTTLPFKGLVIALTSSTPASNNFQFTGTATAARTVLLPDANSATAQNKAAVSLQFFSAFDVTTGAFTSRAVVKADLPATTVSTDQANTWTAGAQDFSGVVSLAVPISSSAAPTASGFIAYNSTGNEYRVGVNGVAYKVPVFTGTDPTAGNCVKWAAGGVLQDVGSACGAGGASALSGITAATGANTIANGDNAQVWNWALITSGKSAFTFGETTAATSAGTPYLVNIQTLSTSTANPLVVTAVGTANGVQVLKTGFLTTKGTGGIDSNMLHCDVTTASKCIQFVLSGITTSTTRSITFQDASGTVAYTNASTLSSLASIGTITTGVWNGTTIAVANGGTGATTFTIHGLLIGQTTGAVTATSAGTATQCLMSNGASADPTFQACPSGGAIMTYSGPLLTLTGTLYFPAGGGGASSGTETNVDVESPAAATATNFYVQLSASPTTGNVTFTWRKNAADTSVACTIASGGATTCSDLTHSFSVAQGDLIDIKAVASGSSAAITVVMATQFGTTGSNGTVNSGTIAQLAGYTATGTAVSGLPNYTFSTNSAVLTVGVAGSTTGNVLLTGATSGTISIKPQLVAGTYNLNLPIDAGAAGTVLTSQGGGSTAMTWTQFFATNAQTATYQVVAADFAACKTIPVASGTFTITLVASGSQPTAGQCVDIINYGTGVVTLARSGQNINGAAANLTGTAGSSTAPTGWHVVSDGTNYVAQVLGGGGSSNTALALMAWPIWGNSYSSGNAVVNATANRGHSQAFLVQYPMTSTSVRFTVGTAAGASKGAQIAFYADGTLTSPVCLSVVGNSGNASDLLDINATGIKSLTWSSGSGVSGGVCTLQPGVYILVMSTDSTALAIANYGSIVGFNQISQSIASGSGLFYRFGDATSAVSTGSNTSVAISTDISAVTWSQAAAATQFSLSR